MVRELWNKLRIKIFGVKQYTITAINRQKNSYTTSNGDEVSTYTLDIGRGMGPICLSWGIDGIFVSIRNEKESRHYVSLIPMEELAVDSVNILNQIRSNVESITAVGPTPAKEEMPIAEKFFQYVLRSRGMSRLTPQ